MPESYEDQLSRVQGMADGDPTWDLSPNDIAALKAVLASHASMVKLAAEMSMRLAAIRAKLEEAVCTKDPDMGVVILSHEAPTHFDTETGLSTYDLEYFSPLGGALIEAWLMTDPDYEGKPNGA